MKAPYFILLVLFLSFSCTKDKKITRDQAKKTIIDEVVNPSTLDHPVMVFLSPERLAKGTRVAPMGFPEETDIMKDDSWFAWIDDEPDAEFEHDTRFVYLSTKTGKYEVKPSQWYPVINDSLFLWTESSKWLSDDLLIFANPPIDLKDTVDSKPL